MILKDLIQKLELDWPPQLAEDWDASGLICGNPSQSIERVLFTVDITHEVLLEAKQMNADLVVAHHPFLLRGLKFMPENSAKGAVLSSAIKNDIAIYAAHTNADNATDGVSDALASVIGLVDTKPLIEVSPAVGAARIGKLREPVSIGDLANTLAKALPATVAPLRVAGDYEQLVSRVAVCGGAGDSFIDLAYAQGAELFVTADLRHHPVQEVRERAIAESRNFSLIDLSHWASEWLWLDIAAAKLKNQFNSLDVVVSNLCTDPWTFTISN